MVGVRMVSSSLRGLYCTPRLRLGPAWLCMVGARGQGGVQKRVRLCEAMPLFHESMSEYVLWLPAALALNYGC